ncbi:MAG: stage III sporulation protein AG [Lachnospiraceae bacterium]|nr:stage III sporulation protein AG [Lachnospiraceae bacterium]
MDLQTWVTKGKEKLLSFGVKQWGMLLIAGLCCLIIVFPMGSKEESGAKEKTENGTVLMPEMQETKGNEDYAELLEGRLSELLSSVEHVGRVKVMITMSGTTTKHVLQDGSRSQEQVTEQDSAGGSRTSVSERSEGTTVFYDAEGEMIPYILGESYPEIAGVVVIAEGSGTGTVDFDIMNAVQVLFDVPAHKIKIMKMK